MEQDIAGGPKMSLVNAFFKWLLALIVCFPIGLIGFTYIMAGKWNMLGQNQILMYIVPILSVVLILTLLIGLIKMKTWAVILVSLITIVVAIEFGQLVWTYYDTLKHPLFRLDPSLYTLPLLIKNGIHLFSLIIANIYFWSNKKYLS